MSKRKRNEVTTVTTMWFNGKEVLTPYTFDLSPNLQADCYVDGRVVHELTEELIFRAVSWSHDYMQPGVPLRSRKNPDTGELEKVYLTFEKVSDAGHGIWRYCGKCFKGEREERYVCFERGIIMQKETEIIHDKHNKIPRKFGVLRGVMLVKTNLHLPGDVIFVRPTERGYLAYNPRTDKYGLASLSMLRNGNVFELKEVI